MTPITIQETDFQALHGKVVVVTGGSSGIGLATVRLLRQQHASIVIADRQPPKTPDTIPGYGDAVTFVQADVTSWEDMKHVFQVALNRYSRLDHVFANAGTVSRDQYIVADILDEHGDLKAPNHTVLQVNLIGVVNTVKLAIHHLRKQQHPTSIVLTASTAAYQQFSSIDYCTAKHGVLGLMRGLAGHLHPHVPIRVNAIAPSWTETGMVSKDLCAAVGAVLQAPDAVARSVVLLMADEARDQQLIYSSGGRYKEIEADLLAAADGVKLTKTSEGEDFQRMMEEVANRAAMHA